MSVFLSLLLFFFSLLTNFFFQSGGKKENLGERKPAWQKARTGTRDGRRDGERYPEEETRDAPEAKDSGIKASLKVCLKGAL